MMKKRFLELEKKRLFPGIRGYIWNWSGVIGNLLFSREAPDIESNSGLRLLNLGCGSCRMAGWVNADFYRLHNLVWNRKLLPDWMVDLTKPLKCNDDYWDGVLLEHVNEHLLHSTNYDLFKEVYRSLKPGGVCRIVVPDLDRYLNWDKIRNEEPKMSRYSSLAEAVSNLTQNHLHVSIWNYDLLTETLKDVGFSIVERSEYRVSSLEEMKVDTESHKWESLYVEAHK